jgi:SnoaL-like domain
MKSLTSLAHSLHYAIPIFLVLLNPVAPTSYPKCTPAPAPATAPGPFPLSELLDYYYQPPSNQSAADLLGVQVSESQTRNKLSLYALALDAKNYAGLDYVLTEDIVANFSAPIGVVKGLANVKEAVQKALEGVDTQKFLGTQVIDVDPSNP